MKPFKIAALSAAVMMSLAGCNSADKPAEDQNRLPLAECKTLSNAPEIIVKGNNQKLTAQTITIAATGDMHGRIRAYDYALDREVNSAGLSKIATLLKEERASNPDMIMIDLGDSVQGNSAELFNDMPIHPVVETMNLMEYDLWVPGNHEFDFERSFLDRNLSGFKGSAISSNIVWDQNSDACSANNENVPFLPGFQIFDVNGARVAFVGVTPAMVPNWQASNPDNFRNLAFKAEVESIRNAIDEAEKKYQPDVVIAALHLGRLEAGTGTYEVASELADKIDVIFMGHEHAQFIEQMEFGGPVEGPMKDITTENAPSKIEDKAKSGVYNDANRHTKVKVIEPGKWGWALAKAEIKLEKNDDGRWKIVDTTLSNLGVNDVDEDTGIQEHARKIHEKSVEDARQEIGKVEGNFTNSSTGYADEATSENYYVTDKDGARLYTTIHHGKVADMPLVDLVNKVQIHKVEEAFSNNADIEFTQVDISAASLFADTSNLLDGQVYRKKDSSNLYMYDNMLVAVKIQGKNLKDYMEWSYSYLNSWKEGDITASFNPAVRPYNYDQFDGTVQYEVDLSKAARKDGHDGQRIIIREIAGKPFDADATYVLAVNDYRYGSTMLPNGWITKEDKIWDSSNEKTYAVRDMLTDLVKEQGGLKRDDFVNQNWFITQYGKADDSGVVADENKGDILTLREGKGKALWERLQNKEICVMVEGERNPSIAVSVNIHDENSWKENPNFREGATQQELNEGCSR